MTVFWDVAPYRRAIALMMEAVSTSETSVNFYQTTWRNISEDSHHYNLLRENLKSHHGEKLLKILHITIDAGVYCIIQIIL
jgi:hypothetical protein